MSNRERWIVYPLLLFAVGSAFLDRVRDQGLVRFGTVQCEKLIVASPDNIPQVVLGQSAASRGGLVAVHGPPAQASPEASPDVPVVQDVQAEIGAGPHGGFVHIAGADGVPSLLLGHQPDHQLSGLVAMDRREQLFTRPETEPTADQEQQAPIPAGTVWGTTLDWKQVPNAQRDFERAKSQLGDEDPAADPASQDSA